MFKKSILELHLKDKLFFLLVAIFAIGGLGLAVKTGVGYLINSIKGHQKDTSKKVVDFNKEYGQKIKDALDAIPKMEEKVKKTTNKIDKAASSITGFVEDLKEGKGPILELFESTKTETFERVDYYGKRILRIAVLLFLIYVYSNLKRPCCITGIETPHIVKIEHSVSNSTLRFQLKNEQYNSTFINNTIQISFLKQKDPLQN